MSPILHWLPMTAANTNSTTAISTPGAYQSVLGGGTDAFLAKFKNISPITGIGILCVSNVTTLSNATLGGTWTSSNLSIATVGSTTGVVTGVSAGTVIISYTVDGASVTTIVTINPLPVSGTITGGALVCLPTTTTLSSTAPGGSWSSGNPLVATIGASSGIVSGSGAGAITISYTVTNACGSSFTTISLIVDTLPAVTASIVGSSIVCAGDTTTLTDATQFFARLTGISEQDVDYLAPESEDLIEEGMEYRVLMDVGGYKEERNKKIERMALQKADDARILGEPIELEPMSPSDRRVVHMALQVFDDIKTESVGEGNDRRVKIIPISDKEILKGKEDSGSEEESEE